MKKKNFLSNNKNIEFNINNKMLIIKYKNNYVKNKKEIDIRFLTFNSFNNYMFLSNKKIFFKKYLIKYLYLKFKKQLISILRGFCLILDIIGLGFNVTIWKLNYLRFNIGYNHLIYYKIPNNIIIKSRYRRKIYLFSNSFFYLKKISTEIKNFRKLSIYKLKGIKEKNELYIKKN